MFVAMRVEMTANLVMKNSVTGGRKALSKMVSYLKPVLRVRCFVGG